MQTSVFIRRAADQLFEDAAEMRRMLKSRLMANVNNFQTLLGQQFYFGLVDSQMVQILKDRRSTANRACLGDRKSVV